MKTNKAFSPTRRKASHSLIVELDYNRNLDDFSKTIDKFKELKIGQKQELVKNEEDDLNILYYEDIELKDLINNKEFAEKEFNIVNNFLRVEEEENLYKKESFEDKDTKFNFELQPDDDTDIVLKQLNNKKLLDEEFQPGLFTSFDFKDKIKSLVFNSLTPSRSNFDFNNKNFNYKRKNDSSDLDFDEIKPDIEDMDGFILDLCLGDKNLDSDDIIINFNDENHEEEKKLKSSLEEEKTNFEGFKKSDAIPEYENQIISFQNYYQIEHKEDLSNHPKFEEESLDGKVFDYLANVSKIIQDKGLKNKIKLIMKLLFFKDDKSKKNVFNNKEKNELLLYWKNSYIKELEDATFKEKNKILQQKLDSLDPNNKIIEMSRNKKGKSKSHNRKSSLGSYSSLSGGFRGSGNFIQVNKKSISRTSVSRKKS